MIKSLAVERWKHHGHEIDDSDRIIHRNRRYLSVYVASRKLGALALPDLDGPSCGTKSLSHALRTHHAFSNAGCSDPGALQTECIQLFQRTRRSGEFISQLW